MRFLKFFSLCALAALFLSGCGKKAGEGPELLNVSYDPTRELWKDLNAQFIPKYEKETGTKFTIKQSHSGSSNQARSVVEGLAADVVTLALPSDTESIAKAGLINAGWEDRLPNKSLPYYSTIVFVVRKGNPKGVKDWPDLIAKPDIEIITPNPKTSGNGQLSFYAAWGSVTTRGGTEEKAREYVTELYKHVKVMDTGARAATATFVEKKRGDVHLAWENEARREVEDAKGELELVFPPVSIRAEPKVAVVDKNVDRKGTRAIAEAYLKYLDTEEAQNTIAKHYYRPSNDAVLKKNADKFPEIKLFTVNDISKGWDDAFTKFIGTGGEFDKTYKKEGK